MSGNAHGGNDSLTSTGDYQSVVGDAAAMDGDASGGNDRLSATGDRNVLVGDSFNAYNYNICGE